MLFESVKNIVSLSIPIPQPPVGGRPYSSAVLKEYKRQKDLKEICQRCASPESFVHEHCLIVPASLVLGLLREPRPLNRRVVQFGVRVADLLLAAEELEPLGESWLGAVPRPAPS